MSELSSFTYELPTISQPEVLKSDTEEATKILNKINKTAVALEVGASLIGRPDPEIQNALQDKPFINTDLLKAKPVDVVINAADPNVPLEIPTNLIVDAGGFTSWLGRDPRVKKSIDIDGIVKTLPSYDVIKLYAKKETKMPPLHELNAFIQPDGHILIAGSNDGSHRIGAAIVKGERAVETYSLRIRYLD